MVCQLLHLLKIEIRTFSYRLDDVYMNRDVSAYSSIKPNAVYPFWDATPTSESIFTNPLQVKSTHLTKKVMP